MFGASSGAGGVGLSVLLWVLAKADVALPTPLLIGLGIVALAFVVGGIVAWLLGLRLRGEMQNEDRQNQQQEASPGAQQVSASAGRDSYAAGRDINITDPGPPQVPWPERAGGPQFRMSPGWSDGKLLCEFDIVGAPGGIKARWIVGGVETDWVRVMPQDRRGGPPHYQLEGVPVTPQHRRSGSLLKSISTWMMGVMVGGGIGP